MMALREIVVLSLEALEEAAEALEKNRLDTAEAAALVSIAATMYLTASRGPTA